jgi:hypothetical protein
VLVAFPPPALHRRWTVLIRFFLAIPLSIVVGFFGVAVFVVVFLGWFAAVATGRAPAFVRNLTTQSFRMNLRLYAYIFFLTDRFPAFDVNPVRGDQTQMAVPDATRLNRGSVSFRLILLIPAGVLGSLVLSGVEVISVLMWFVMLATGKLPEPVRQAFEACIRYQTRLVAYVSLVPSYPSALFGDPRLPRGRIRPSRRGGSPSAVAAPSCWRSPSRSGWPSRSSTTSCCRGPMPSRTTNPPPS